jgi:hypothetical protein
MLKFQKRFVLAKGEIKKRAESDHQFDREWASGINNFFTEMSFSLAMIEDVNIRLKDYFNLSKEITAKNSLELVMFSKQREVENCISKFKDTETLSMDIMAQEVNLNQDYDYLFHSLVTAIKAYEIQIKADSDLILNNFFSLDETDISEFEYKFNKTFEKVNKNALNKLIFDNNLSLDGYNFNNNADQLQKSIILGTQSKMFEEKEKCQDLAKMVIFFKSIGLIVKRLCRVMKNIGVENLAIYTRYRFDSLDFLAFNKDQQNTIYMLKKEWHRDKIALKNISTKIELELKNIKVLSSNTYSNLNSITVFLNKFLKYVERIENNLKATWNSFNKNFEALRNGVQDDTWREAKYFFDSFNSPNPRVKLSDILISNSEIYEEFNNYIEE